MGDRELPTVEDPAEEEGADEIAAIIKAASAMLEALSRLEPLTTGTAEVASPQALYRILNPLLVNIENLLPVLRDRLDVLEVARDLRAGELKRLINGLDSDLLYDLIAYKDRLGRSLARGLPDTGGEAV